MTEGRGQQAEDRWPKVVSQVNNRAELVGLVVMLRRQMAKGRGQ